MTRRGIFRKAALDRLASPEQLDALLEVTGPGRWLVLVALVGLVGSGVAWGLLGTVETRVAGSAFFVRTAGLFEVAATTEGRIVELPVALGDAVEEGQVVARIDQPARRKLVEQARDELRALEQQQSMLVATGREAIRLAREGIAQERASAHQQIALARDRIAYGRERLVAQETLLAKGLVTKQQLRVTSQEIAAARREVSAAEDELTRLASREQDLTRQAAEEDVTRAARLEEQRRRIAVLEDDLARTSVVTSPRTGRVIEVRTAEGRLVAIGMPLVNLEVTDDRPAEIAALVYLSAVDGKQVRPGMRIELEPSNVRAEEHGRLVGEVESVTDFPVTRQALQSALVNDDLVERFMQETGGAPIVARARLLRECAGAPGEGYQWTTPSSKAPGIGPGTLAAATVVVRSQRPVELLIPLARRLSGE